VSRRSPLAVWLAVAASVAALAPLGQAEELPPSQVPSSSRIVAVGDVHGSIDGLTSILQESGIIDEEHRWSGGDATLVQEGDLLDRGVHLQEVLDLLMRLEEEAPRAGGRVVVLLGNHETMNLLGITRDVNRDAFARFAGPDSDQRQHQALSTYLAFERQRLADLGEAPAVSAEAAEQWLALHPPGFVEYAEAMGPEGRYGSWLRQRPAAVILGDTLFIHGGYGPALAGKTIAEINARVAAELATFDETRQWMVSEGLALPWSSSIEMVHQAQREIEWIGRQPPDTVPPERRARAERLLLNWNSWYLVLPDGPFWYRGLASSKDAPSQDEVAALLDSLGVRRQVVGHSPRRNGRIESRYGGRVLLIDTGMLKPVYGGRPSALEIVGDHLAAIYPGERVDLAPQPATP